MDMIKDQNRGAWKKELQHWFVKFFQKFLGYLKKGNLPHHFDPKVNLLVEFKQVNIQKVIKYLQRIERKNSYEELLQRKV
jgi:hypothetical protein